jgi:hypothetical protein
LVGVGIREMKIESKLCAGSHSVSSEDMEKARCCQHLALLYNQGSNYA